MKNNFFIETFQKLFSQKMVSFTRLRAKSIECKYTSTNKITPRSTDRVVFPRGDLPATAKEVGVPKG